MSKPVGSSHETGADVERVHGVLAGPGWADRRAAALGDGSRVVERQERADGGVRLVMSRELPAGGPGFLQRFLPPDRRVVQTDDWGPPQDGGRRGTWQVAIPGVPARLEGTMALEPTATGSRHVVDGTITVPVPLVGGKAEAFIAEMVDKLGAREAEVLREALSDG